MANRSPFKNRELLLKDISSFITRNKSYFYQNSTKINSLFEMTIYNDVVKFYKRHKYEISICNLTNDGSFRYKLSPAGLSENFSYFKANKKMNTIEIHHNIKNQSFFDPHIYYTADISVCTDEGVEIVKQTNGKRHSYISNKNIITFFEVKHLNPFPEILFSFTGIVMEINPRLIMEKDKFYTKNKNHLAPSIIFSGHGSKYTERTANKLSERYKYNIITGLFENKRQIYSLRDEYEYID